MTSVRAFAYGRAATTRSCARFIFDAATISIVRVIFRVFSTDLMRPFSSRPLAMAQSRRLTNGSFHGRSLLARPDRLLVRLDPAPQIRFELLRQVLRLTQSVP